ncbi:hypothetical protein D3C85_1608300 [compost metagenome]
MPPTKSGRRIYHQLIIKPLIASIICVMAGSEASGPARSLIVLPIIGMTKIIRPKKARMVMKMSTIG